MKTYKNVTKKMRLTFYLMHFSVQLWTYMKVALKGAIEVALELDL